MDSYRLYGEAPFHVVLLHGGPGAAGSLAPLAEILHHNFPVLEYLQRHYSIDEELKRLDSIMSQFAEKPVILVGHSWGAWLGFIYASRFANKVKKLILIASGPFEEKYTKNLVQLRENRLQDYDRERLSILLDKLNDPTVENKDQVFTALGKLMDKADSYQALPFINIHLKCNFGIYKSIWKEASWLRKSGELLRHGYSIKCPVVAIHGDYDPHPYLGVQKPLSETLQNFRFIFLENCGHKPWLEKFAREEFIKILRQEIET